MDSLLLYCVENNIVGKELGFNPYSNGFSSFINLTYRLNDYKYNSFNPYSNGFSSFIEEYGYCVDFYGWFQSLF